MQMHSTHAFRFSVVKKLKTIFTLLNNEITNVCGCLNKNVVLEMCRFSYLMKNFKTIGTHNIPYWS